MHLNDPLMQILMVSYRELPVLLTSLLGALIALGFLRRRRTPALLAFLGCGLLFFAAGVSTVERVHVQQSKAIDTTPRPAIGRPLREPSPAFTIFDIGIGAGQVAGLSLLIAAALVGRCGTKPVG